MSFRPFRSGDLRSRALRLAAIGLVSLGSSPVEVFAEAPPRTTIWNGGSGGWSTAGNWSLGVPRSVDTALFTTSGTAFLGNSAVAEILEIQASSMLASGTLTLLSPEGNGNLWMNTGARTTLTLTASDTYGDVFLDTPTATIGASDTNNGVDVGGYIETNVLNLATSTSGIATLSVAGDLNIGNDGSGNAVQGSPNGTSGASKAVIAAGSIKVSIAATAGAVDYNWIGTYGANDELTATNLQVGIAGDKGGAENFGGTWTLTNTIIGDQAGSDGNYVTLREGTITNNGQMVVGLGGSSNTLNVGDDFSGTFDMSSSTSDLEIGSLAGATGNGVSVDYGTLLVGKRIIVGNAGGSNYLEVGSRDSGSVTSGGIDVGRASSGNTVSFDQGSTATIQGSVRLGDNGSNNSMFLRYGSVVTLTEPNKDFTIGYGSSVSSSGNKLDIRHAGSKLVMHGANSALWISGVTGVGGGTGNIAIVRDGGVLDVDNVIVAPGGTLAGNSSVVGTVSVGSGGVVAPGDGTAGSIATLLVTGSVDFLPIVGGAGLLAIDIDGSTSDLLSVSGNLDISGATLDLDFLGPTLTMEHVIAEYGTLTGTFGSVLDLPSGWYVDYAFGGANKIAVVPEPSTLVLVGLGLVSLAARRVRRRRS